MKKEQTPKLLLSLGLLSPVAGGIQIDLNTVTQKVGNRFRDADLCDHNCVASSLGGKYNCPAAYSLNHHLLPKTLAPKDLIVSSIEIATRGIKNANSYFSKNLAVYGQENEIPQVVQELLLLHLQQAPIEVNLFGGNPEMHPELPEIIDELSSKNLRLNLTTTGRRLLTDKQFYERLKARVSKLDVIALSADDFENPGEIKNLAILDPHELKKRWQKTDPRVGQRQKALEAIYTANLFNRERGKILFNLVLHSGNLSKGIETASALKEFFPNSIVNPYPVQTAFGNETPALSEKNINQLAAFIDWAISMHFQPQNSFLTPHLHYWLMLKAAIETNSGNTKRAGEMIEGNNIWRCYDTPGAARYVQIGKSPKVSSQSEIPGLTLNCYWNPVTIGMYDKKVFQMQSGEVTNYILKDIQDTARKSPNPCLGCAFPRLNFDMISTELGMSGEIKPTYLKLRKQYVGF